MSHYQKRLNFQVLGTGSILTISIVSSYMTFLRNNDLEVVDFNFKQDVPYTFFNSTSNTYIDYVF